MSINENILFMFIPHERFTIPNKVKTTIYFNSIQLTQNKQKYLTIYFTIYYIYFDIKQMNEEQFVHIY